MPEGPSLVILKEALAPFAGKKVLKVEGTAKKIDITELEGEKITGFKTWGKHLLICFNDFAIRVHLMLFGTYRINERKENVKPMLSLQFSKGEVNFYTSSLRRVDYPLDDTYDWSADVMSPDWDNKKALAKLEKMPDTLVCDALLDQEVFAGVGNIIKNEVLFRIRVHPLSKVGKLPAAKLKLLAKEAVKYSFQFYEWKKEYTLKAHWLVHTRKTCPRDHIPLEKGHLGRTHRRSFFCNKCQKLYD